MRNRVLFFIMTAITAGVLSSCIYNDYGQSIVKDPSEQTIETDVKFLSNIFRKTSSSSRLIEGEEWEAGDAIGVYMIEKHNNDIVDDKNNVKYISPKGGYVGFFVANSDFIEFPKDGRDVRFMSYYPYKKTVRNATYNIDISKQYPQSDLDFFYSFETQNTYNKDLETKNIPISFTNQMTKIFIHIRNGNGLQGYHLADMNVYFSGLSTYADFNLLTGKMKYYNSISPIYPSRLIAGKGNVYSSEAVVIPSSDLSGAKIIIDLNNGNANKESDVYTVNLGKELVKGKRYTYNIVVSLSGITVNSAVHNWTVL